MLPRHALFWIKKFAQQLKICYSTIFQHDVTRLYYECQTLGEWQNFGPSKLSATQDNDTYANGVPLEKDNKESYRISNYYSKNSKTNTKITLTTLATQEQSNNKNLEENLQVKDMYIQLETGMTFYVWVETQTFLSVSHGATARCLADYAKYVLRDNPDNIVFDIKINDASSNKTA